MTEQEKIELEAMMRAMARSLFPDYLEYIARKKKAEKVQNDDKSR